MTAEGPTWKTFTGGFATATVVLSAVALSGFAVSTALAVSGAIPIWAAVLINTICGYLAFTPAHEAAHGNIHGTAHSWRWLNEGIGWACGVILLAPFSAFRVLHLTHHSHTNDPEKDPDYHVVGHPVAVVLRCLTIVPYYYWDFLFGPTSRTGAAQKARRSVLLGTTAYGLVIVLGTGLGFGEFIVWLWVVPSALAGGLLALVFDWLPHVPHKSTERYFDTRVLLFPGLSILMVGQNYHLIHHLYPRIPFYRYGACFDAVRPMLEAKGANIQDLWGRAPIAPLSPRSKTP